MNINIIVATDLNNGIGKDNQLLWTLPKDMKIFKKLTTGTVVIMGRKTYDSIGRPLPNRFNIVITTQHNLKIDGVNVVHSLEEAINLAKKQDKDIYVIGGAKIYDIAIPYVNKIYLSKVHTTKDVDAFFPTLNLLEWNEYSKTYYESDEKNEYSFDFIEYNRI
jgi:dihydrofolate reductase